MNLMELLANDLEDISKDFCDAETNEEKTETKEELEQWILELESARGLQHSKGAKQLARKARQVLLKMVRILEPANLNNVLQVEAQPVEPEPVEPEPVEAQPVEPEPVEAEQVEAERVEAEPVEAEPVEAERVEAEPVEAEPVEAEQVNDQNTEITPKPASKSRSTGPQKAQAQAPHSERSTAVLPESAGEKPKAKPLEPPAPRARKI